MQYGRGREGGGAQLNLQLSGKGYPARQMGAWDVPEQIDRVKDPTSEMFSIKFAFRAILDSESYCARSPKNVMAECLKTRRTRKPSIFNTLCADSAYTESARNYPSRFYATGTTPNPTTEGDVLSSPPPVGT